MHCVQSTNRLKLRAADGRAYVEFNTPTCGGKGAKCRQWSVWDSSQTYQIDTHLSTLNENRKRAAMMEHNARHK